MGHAAILVPFGAGNMGAYFVAMQVGRRRLQPDMLDRVRGKLRADQAFDDIKKPRVREQVKDSRPKMHRRVGEDFISRKRDVQRLEPVQPTDIAMMKLSEKIQIPRSLLQHAIGNPSIDKRIQQAGILGAHRCQNTLFIEQVFDNEIAVFFKKCRLFPR